MNPRPGVLEVEALLALPWTLVQYQMQFRRKQCRSDAADRRLVGPKFPASLT
jgi:hypothetical protein